MSIITRAFERLAWLFPGGVRLPLRCHLEQCFGNPEQEIGWLRHFLQGRRGVAVDVGANRGCYALALSGLCDAVVAFEPHPYLTADLRAFARTSGRRITVHHVCLGDQDGSEQLYVPLIQRGNRVYRASGLSSLRKGAEGSPLTVPVRRLDSYALRDVSFIKIDVEGYEQSVLCGAMETVARWRPSILIEVEQRHLGTEANVMRTFDTITRWGYRGFFLRDGKLVPISEFSCERNQSPYEAALVYGVRPRGYVNNFVFFPT